MVLELKSFKKVPFCRFWVVDRERVGYRNMPCIFVIVPWQKVRRVGAIFIELLWRVVCYCWMMFRVDKCPNEDPRPLPGPRLAIGAEGRKAMRGA